MLINNDKSFLHISQLQVPRSSFSDLERHHFINSVYSLTPGYQSNFNEHIKFVDRYVVANPSQERLADQADTSTRTTRRFIQEAEDNNIFKFIRNIYKKNIIIPNPIIFDRKVRIILQKDFTAFRNLPIVKSLINSENVLLTNTKNLNTKNKESNTSDITDSKSENKGLIAISKVIPLDNYQTRVLSEFDSSYLLEALGVLKGYPNVKDKFRFIVKVCENKKNKTQPVRYESNRQQDGGYYKKEFKDPITNRNHSPQLAAPSKIDTVDELKINIERITKEIIECNDKFVKSYKTACLKSLLERLQYYQQSINNEMEVEFKPSKINPGSPSLNETTPGKTNTHQVKKDSPTVKFDTISKAEPIVVQNPFSEPEYDPESQIEVYD